MRRTLWRGTLLAAAGALPILFSGVFLKQDALADWGWLIFLAGMALIALGLIPYRRLCKLEMNPNQLIIKDENFIDYYVKNKLVMSIPIDSIANIDYIEKNQLYGIDITLKSNKKMFLPYFTQRTAQQVIQG